jgi:hypothetical protein
VYIRKNWREGEARTRKKNHHPILQLTYSNSSPATERMPKTPRRRRRRRRRRSIPTQVREKRISRPLPRPTKRKKARFRSSLTHLSTSSRPCPLQQSFLGKHKCCHGGFDSPKTAIRKQIQKP